MYTYTKKPNSPVCIASLYDIAGLLDNIFPKLYVKERQCFPPFITHTSLGSEIFLGIWQIYTVGIYQSNFSMFLLGKFFQGILVTPLLTRTMTRKNLQITLT